MSVRALLDRLALAAGRRCCGNIGSHAVRVTWPPRHADHDAETGTREYGSPDHHGRYRYPIGTGCWRCSFSATDPDLPPPNMQSTLPSRPEVITKVITASAGHISAGQGNTLAPHAILEYGSSHSVDQVFYRTRRLLHVTVERRIMSGQQ